MSTEKRPVEHFFRILLEEIEQSSSPDLDQPFTIAEIYQTLIPYRTHRDRLGVQMNGDYEDTLLRLLAGEGDFLLLESEAARSRIRQELAHSNPNTGVYREFAAVGVRLNPERASDLSSTASDHPSPAKKKNASPQTSLDSLGFIEETPSGASPVTAPPAPVEPILEKRASEPLQEDLEVAGSELPPCPDCGKDLPQRATLRFCPHCGTNILLAPCRECGEVLERSWKYCLSCGTPAR